MPLSVMSDKEQGKEHQKKTYGRMYGGTHVGSKPKEQSFVGNCRTGRRGSGYAGEYSE